MSPVYIFGGSPNDPINKINNDVVLRDGSNTLTGTLDMGVNKISRVVDPVDNQEAATKKYVDNASIPKIQNPNKKLVVSNEEGNVVDSSLSVNDVITKSSNYAIQNPINQLTVSTDAGYIIDSDLKVDDVFTKTNINKHDIPLINNLNNKLTV